MEHLQNKSPAVVEADRTVVDTGKSLPYGLDRSGSDLLQSTSYKFTDQEQDVGTGLYSYDARLYDPVIGQFIMADTIVPDLFNPQSLSRYAYCLNNPLKYIDPSGHDYTGPDTGSDPMSNGSGYGGSGSLFGGGWNWGGGETRAHSEATAQAIANGYGGYSGSNEAHYDKGYVESFMAGYRLAEQAIFEERAYTLVASVMSGYGTAKIRSAVYDLGKTLGLKDYQISGSLPNNSWALRGIMVECKDKFLDSVAMRAAEQLITNYISPIAGSILKKANVLLGELTFVKPAGDPKKDMLRPNGKRP